eukprot:61547_1
MATKSWLDLMAEDSNLSIASIKSLKSVNNNNSKSIDPELDNSQQGINLLIKTNMKFLVSDDSQSRKRRFKQIQTVNNDDEKCFLPPKAKQRTNERGQWKKRKHIKNETATNFQRFLNMTNENEEKNKNENENENNTIKIVENESEENEDDDLNEIIFNKKPKRITPILANIVFNRDLILHKVPIISKKDANSSFTQLPNAPIFLNADQIDEKQSEKQKQIQKLQIQTQIDEYENKQIDETQKQLQETETEIKIEIKKYENEIQQENESKEEEYEEDCSVWYGNDNDNETGTVTGKLSWAVKLFPTKVRENKLEKEKEELNLVNNKKKDRLSELMISSILPPVSVTPSNTTCTIITDDEDNDIDVDYKPSNDAEIWRKKQIKMGKNTIGYMNYIKIYPNKDTRFRLNNNLLLTPDSREKIGKKRWCGKYSKWRKFLHQFDNI